MRKRSPISGLILSLLAVMHLFAHSAAQAAHGGVSVYTICTGSGLTTITVDQNGDPVPMTVPCPDCVQGLATLPSLTQSFAPKPLRFDRLVPDYKAPQLTSQPPLQTKARAPPVV